MYIMAAAKQTHRPHIFYNQRYKICNIQDNITTIVVINRIIYNILILSIISIIFKL